MSTVNALIDSEDAIDMLVVPGNMMESDKDDSLHLAAAVIDGEVMIIAYLMLSENILIEHYFKTPPTYIGYLDGTTYRTLFDKVRVVTVHEDGRVYAFE